MKQDHWSINNWADYWYYQVGVNPLPGDTKTKIPKEEWKQFQGKSIPVEVFDHWKKENKFRDGIIIIVGKVWHNDRKKGLHLIAIDLDNELAIKEFCTINGEQKTLKQLAETGHFLIEQHPDNETRAHVYLWSDKPYKKLNRNGDSKVPQIEVKGAGEHGLMCVTPSVHKNGSKYQIIGDPTNFVDLPQVHDEIEKHIDSILSKYGIPYLFESDRNNSNNNNATDGFFRFNANEKIKKGSRHNFLIKYANSLIRKNHKSTPLDAIKQTVEYINKTYFEEPLPDAEVQQIFNDAVDFISKQIDQEKDQGIDSFPEIANNMHYQLSKTPPTYIVALKDSKQVAEVTIKQPKSKEKGRVGFSTDTVYLFYNRTYLACIPVRIVRHKNPLAFLQTIQKYSMTFVDKVEEKHTFIQKTLAEIVQQLRDLGYVLSDGADKALNALLQAYIQNKFIEDNEETDYIGFFKDKDNGIFASNVVIKEPNISKLADAITCLEELKRFYDKRLDLLATSIVWGMIAPVMFILKQNNRFLKLLHFYGFANATKTNTAKVILALDGHQEDQRFNLVFSRFDTEARVGDALSHTTFPILVDEMNLNDPKTRWLVELLKTIVESLIARTKFPGSRASGTIDIPALSLPILVGNPPPPLQESAYMKRTIVRYFSKSETRLDNDPQAVEFREFMRVNVRRLKALGDFRNWYVMNNQKEILDEDCPASLELGLKILKAAFEYVGIQIPNWLLEERLPEDQLEESIADNEVIVNGAFEKYIIEEFSKAIQVWRQRLDKGETLDLPNSTTARLEDLAQDNLIPHIKWSTRRLGVIIHAGILTELYNHGVTEKQLPNLRALANYMNAKYGKYGGKMSVFADRAVLTEYFDGETDTETDE